VGELVALVGGSRNGNGISTNAEFGMRNAESNKPGGNGRKSSEFRDRPDRIGAGSSEKKRSNVKVASSTLKGPKPEQVIPMEEGSFKEF